MPVSDIFAAFRWWVVLLLLGAAAMPLTTQLLRRLPDRGYAFSKMIGLLVVSYLFWLAASLGIAGNNYGGILLAVLGLIGLSLGSLYLAHRQTSETPSESLPGWLRRRWRFILLIEMLFLAVFALWVWVRAQNPSITATEKPMEFAFLNSAVRSPEYPPLDPWLSGFAISYYYFGYIMTSVLSRLAVVPTTIGFNLAIAWLTAGTALGAFGLVYNLLAADRRQPDDRPINNLGSYGEPAANHEASAKPATRYRLAVILGLVAAVALPLAGNMEIVLEIMHANGIGTPQFWEWLDIRELEGPARVAETPRYETSQWWWWRSSRVIHEYHLSGRPEEGLEPIAEFPAFSFNLGDMHPHVLALPFAFLSLAVAFTWWLRPGFPELNLRFWRPGWHWRDQAARLGLEDWQSWGLAVLLLGGLSFLNTWDVLIHLFVFLGAFVLTRWRQSGQWHSRYLGEAVILALFLGIPAVLIYLPFYLGFRSQAGAPFLLPMTMQPTRLAHFLVIFAMPLLPTVVLVTLLVFKAIRQRRSRPVDVPRAWRPAMTLAIGLIVGLFVLMLVLGWLIAMSPDGAGRVIALAGELAKELPVLPVEAPLFYRLRWGAAAVAVLTPVLLQVRLANPWLILLLTGLLAAAIYILIHYLQRSWLTGDDGNVLEDRLADGFLESGGGQESDFSPSGGITAGLRQPDTAGISPLPFVLLIIITGLLLTIGPEFVYLKDNFGQRINTIFKFYYQAWVMFGVAAIFGLGYLLSSRHRLLQVGGVVTTVVYGLALLMALLFPYYAVQSRAAEFRGPRTAEDRQPATLDGLTFLVRSNPDEYAAIMWLRENVDGAPVILEATGGAYSDFARVSANTGLPTVLGWANHEGQWRGNTPEPGLRAPAIATIYSQANWSETADLLNRYDVAYVYFGSLERSTYDPRSGEKFDQNLEVAYRNASVTIYRWQPQ
jgi:YYY domain-containing protein